MEGSEAHNLPDEDGQRGDYTLPSSEHRVSSSLAALRVTSGGRHEGTAAFLAGVGRHTGWAHDCGYDCG